MPAAAVAISHAATSRSATRPPARSPPQRQHRVRCVSRNVTSGGLSSERRPEVCLAEPRPGMTPKKGGASSR
eukprot:2262902-Prymnesium_polylepis.1